MTTYRELRRATATLADVATLRLFASIREAAGERTAILDGATVADILANATERFGEHFGLLVPTCRVWVNGEPAMPGTAVGPADEVALLPPVSGG